MKNIKQNLQNLSSQTDSQFWAMRPKKVEKNDVILQTLKNQLLNVKKPPFLLLNFEISTLCNAKCPSCYRTSLINWGDVVSDEHYFHKYKHIKVEDFEYLILNNISYFKNHGYQHLDAKFCGEVGDPLVHPEIEELIYLASTVFDRVEIFTNGGLRNSRWIDKVLKKYEKLYFVFGIDGVTDEINQKYRIGVRTDLAFSNMLMSAKQRFTKWDFTIFEHNYHQLQEAIDFAEKHKIYINDRINGRPYSKLKEEKISLVEDILKKNSTNYYLCKGAISV